MITIKRYTAEDAAIWDALIDQSKNKTFLLKRGYMDYHSDRFVDHSLLFYKDDELVAVLPASQHDYTLCSHGGLTYGGMVCSYAMKQHTMDECFDALIVYMRKNGIGKLQYKPMPYIYHNYPCQEDLYALWRNCAKVIRRDVASVLEYVDNPIKLPKGRKAQISRAKRERVSIESSTDYETFFALENRVLEQYHGAKAVHTGAEMQLLHSRFPENIRLYTAMHVGIMVAGVVIFVFDNMVHTQYMASSEYGRENGALDLAIATILDEYRGKKQYVDFGTSMSIDGLNVGLISQKEGFGGRSIMYDVYELEV